MKSILMALIGKAVKSAVTITNMEGRSSAKLAVGMRLTVGLAGPDLKARARNYCDF